MAELVLLIKKVQEALFWLVRNLSQVLWIGALIWTIFVSWVLVGYLLTSYPDSFRPPVTFLTNAQPATHIVGAAVLAVAVLATVLPRWRALRLVWPLFRRGAQPEIEILGGSIITEQEVQREIREFSQDALHVQLIAGDADFIKTDDDQYRELLRLGKRCRLLLSKHHRVEPATLKALAGAGVEIRTYPDDPQFAEINLRGRLKRSATGTGACLFDKSASGFRVINLSNENLVGMIMREFDRWFQAGQNPFIKHVVFDLAGVAFDGNIKDFYAAIGDQTNINISAKAEDYSLVSRDLNLGTCDIVAVVQERVGRDLDDAEADTVRTAWSSTWYLNPGMADLAHAIRQADYTMSLCSNCDRENADVYDIKGYFDPFDKVFLSCEMQEIKPEDGFFSEMLKELNVEPWQVLFIDDAKPATDAAKKLGFETISMPRLIAENEKATFVRRHFERLCVRVNGNTGAHSR